MKYAGLQRIYCLIIKNQIMTDKSDINFIAIDFETATSKRASICEVGICVIRHGEIAETR